MPTKKIATPYISSISKEKNEVKSVEVSQIIEDRISSIERKLDALIECLNKNSNVTSHCPKNSEGKRQIQL